MAWSTMVRSWPVATEGHRVTEFGILGPLVVRRDSAELEIRGPRQRALLALLLVHANPTLPAGYVLDVDPDGYDVARLESLVTEARRAASLEHHTVACEMLRQALELWRGPALVEFASEPFAQVEATRLDELWVDVRQEYAGASLACGRVSDAVTMLRPIVREHPLREQAGRSDARPGFEATVGGYAIVDDADPRIARITDIDPDGNIELEILDGVVEAHLGLVTPA
jgi:DNA-binding SARP family transcriptional activator